MENASKALLIAGAVLIVILLIGVGMMIYTGATSSINSSVGQMDAQQVQMFNNQIEQYVGENISGTKVKSLISMVNSNRATNPDVALTLVSGDAAKLTITEPTTAGAAYNITIKSTDRFKIEAIDTTSDGLLDQITITKTN